MGTLTHASLFSGIGGFDLAAEWAGWTNAFNCEIDKFCQKVLKYHFPKAIQYADIKTTDFSIWRGRIDVLTGGFPCQPFSVAGKRQGSDDDRYLWPEMLRAIREISPRWVVGENVRGLVSWSDGLVFEQVCSDLESEGYEVQSFLIPACAVDAPHRRDRIWIVAHRDDSKAEKPRSERDGAYSVNTAADAYGKRLAKQLATEKSSESHRRIGKDGSHRNTPPRNNWDEFPSESPICSRDDGLPEQLDAITFPAWCRESIKALGNAIVPQIAYRIFETINEVER